ncbi:MAG: hypothetical protein EBT27_00075 [Betaproteobacteria bacterium]|nr:hypothetical protein [Betaproteobacteria bacterium]
MRLAALLAFALALSSCGYQGSYRYECQDPANWEVPECNPPLCKVDGACSKDLIGFDPEEDSQP